MKISLLRIIALIAFAHLPGVIERLSAQDTFITYQGRIIENGAPANGTYDLRFTLYDASIGGLQLGNFIVRSATPVTNGLFTVDMNFGTNFVGGNRWIEIGVRTNGGAGFTFLDPRQRVNGKAGDISAVIETPGGFLLYLTKEKTAAVLSVATLSLPKRSYEQWLGEQTKE